MTNYSYISNQAQDNVKIEYYKKDKTNIMVRNKDSIKNIIWSNLDTRTWLSGDETAWYNKEDVTLVKLMAMEGKYVVEYTDWKFNQVTDEDITKPNLIGYTVDSHSTEE